MLRLWLVLAPLAACILAGCGDSDTVYDVQIFDVNGGNPFVGSDIDTVELAVKQDTFAGVTQTVPVENSTFGGDIALESFQAPTRMRVSLRGPTTRLIAAPPRFVPNQTEGVIQLIAGTPSTCSIVPLPVLSADRAFAGQARVAHFWVLIGGSPTDPQFEVIDMLRHGPSLLSSPPSLPNLGAPQAVALNAGSAFVVSESLSFIFSLTDPSMRRTDVSVHAGAAAGTVVRVADNDVWVIGGESGGVPQRNLTVVGDAANVGSLAVARVRPAVVVFGSEVVIAGGDRAGTIEIVSRAGSAETLSYMDGVRENPIVVSDETSMLILGGTDAVGTLRTDTLLVTGCPGACSPQPGPTWSRARAGAVTRPGFPTIVGGTDTRDIEQVAFAEGSAEINLVNRLSVARAGATVLPLESGIVVVAGGVSAGGQRDDVEYCFPATLLDL